MSRLKLSLNTTGAKEVVCMYGYLANLIRLTTKRAAVIGWQPAAWGATLASLSGADNKQSETTIEPYQFDIAG